MNWHLHLVTRGNAGAVLPDAARHFGRAIIMPNLVPPVNTRGRCRSLPPADLAAQPEGSGFAPLMTAYLTETTAADDLAAGFADGVLTAVKLYPAGATTNSASGVRDIAAVMPVPERIAAIGMPLLCHGEVVDAAIDIFDREKVFGC